MAVFTPVTESELASWLEHYALGEPLAFRGTTSGIENSNFFLTTTRGEFVLTIFEKLNAHELPFYLNLMQHLAAHGVPVPDPVPRNDGCLQGELHGKPAAIVTRLAGAAQLTPEPVHCIEVGQMLARLHLAGKDFVETQPNLRGLDWWQSVAPLLHPHLSASQSALLTSELAHQTAVYQSDDYRQLPGGPCHCDLFRDNVLFVTDPLAGRSGQEIGQASGQVPGQKATHDRLGGFFDFYFAGCDKWLFDLAVTVNDWCVDLETGVLDPARTAALLRAYQTVRPLTPIENRYWQDMLRAGALRFWVSRLLDSVQPRAAELLQPHDPGRFERTLRARIAQPSSPSFPCN